MAGFDERLIDADDSGDDYAGIDMESLLLPSGEYDDEDPAPHVEQFGKLVKELVKARFNGLVGDLKAATAAGKIGFAPGESGMVSVNVNAAILEAFGNVINDLTTGGATKFLSAEQGKNLKTYINDGWVPAASWVYASPTTITVPSGAASIYSIGDKYKLTANSVVLQGYIVGIADELLTVKGDVLTDHEFSNVYFSKQANPQGFPHYFNYTPTGVSAANATLAGRFMLQGRRCSVDIKIMFSGGITFTTMPTLPIPASASRLAINEILGVCGNGSYYDNGTNYYPNGIYPVVAPSATVVYLRSGANGTAMSATSPITWANLDGIEVHFEYEI